jgi:hypothetical protein
LEFFFLLNGFLYFFFICSLCFVCLFFLFIQYVFVMSFVSLCFCVLFMLYFSFYACIYRVHVVLCLSYFCWFSLSLHEMYVLLLYIIASVCLYLVCLCFWFDWLQNHITFCVQLNIIGDVFFLLFSIKINQQEVWRGFYLTGLSVDSFQWIQVVPAPSRFGPIWN